MSGNQISSYLTELAKIANAYSARATLQEMMPFKAERTWAEKKTK